MKDGDSYSRRDFLLKGPAAIVSGAVASLGAVGLPAALRAGSRRAPRVPEGSIYTPAEKQREA